jgi:predicted ATP-dependent endonuclease of OLD family
MSEIVEYKGFSALSSIGFQAYKSFSGNDFIEIPLHSNLTLIIGRNNSGKSSLIDVIGAAINPEKRQSGISGLKYGFYLDSFHLERGFSKGTTGGHLNNYSSDYAFAEQFINQVFYVTWDESKFVPESDQKQIFLSWNRNHTQKLSNWDNVAYSYNKELSSVCLRRVNAERDIVPEEESDDEVVSINGNGATNLIRKYINNDRYDETIVESLMLDELNSIMKPDSFFSSIRVQQVKSNNNQYKWEVFLEENGHRFALSKSGSGLKTILLILINLYLIPQTKDYKSKEIVYAFEEIENNLHPALQRRVFEYLYNYSVSHNTTIFLTSHSHIAINTYFGKDKAQMYHIIKNMGISSIKRMNTGLEISNLLDDLDVKASDIFQSNGIIWVEGPSDRIYILHWLSVLTDFQYIEGQHFQFMYYGGKLLSHYTAVEFDEKTNNLINILTMNRNAIMVMDSDKKTLHSRINDTKRRIRDELKKKGMFCWITKGKEIENYVAAEAVNKLFKCELPQIEPYEQFPDYIGKYDKSFISHKVETARKLCEYITSDNSEGILDLSENIIRIYEIIQKWNK